jgi:hypothetical protein
MKKLVILIFLLSLYIASPARLAAAEFSTGGTIFVPAYKGFYQIYGTTRDSYALTSTVFFHNIDPKQTIAMLTIDFFDSNGKLLKHLIENPLLIKPQNSKEITIQPRTQTDEDCATHLIVRWKSDKPANSPVVEVLMVGQVLNRGVSFLVQGYEVKE